ncbi:sugar-phosphatase [Lactobacillus amylolyticus]|uniref:Cof-type HAD-IIB family hydrolase n=1 Tax=Lactobacillus amylolyticus TaxID=83683 RepID=UPI0009B9C732|nr:Cof-type HAD-IIB family hydrolase [Lactobacillus amylolyticus]ARD06936.1 sugar-phosphatase [Lactobacillus amylolyticus]
MTEIPFKAVAVDVDGTFVRDNLTFDQNRFERILAQLKANHIHFIVSSGRPLSRLKVDFANFLDRIDLIADNSAVLVQDNNIISTHYLTPQTGQKLLAFIQEKFSSVDICVSGKDYAYYLQSAPSHFKNTMNYYYPNSIALRDFTEIPADDRIIKLTLNCPADLASTIEDSFNSGYTERIHCTTSGYKDIDIVPYGINKAQGLKYFLRYFKLTSDQLIAFGDGMNDKEMLELAGYSYAMANANPKLFQIAKYKAPSNNDSGVLKVLEDYLNK